MLAAIIIECFDYHAWTDTPWRALASLMLAAGGVAVGLRLAKGEE